METPSASVQFIGISLDVPADLWPALEETIREQCRLTVLQRVAQNGYEPLGEVEFHEPLYYYFTEPGTPTDEIEMVQVFDPKDAEFVRILAEVLSAKG